LKLRLTEEELDTLRDKYPAGLSKRIKLLFKLDKLFCFNRSKLSKFLSNDLNLVGYSRTQIFRLLGKPAILRSTYLSLLKEVKKGNMDNNLLLLIISKRIRKKYEDASNNVKGHPHNISSELQ